MKSELPVYTDQGIEFIIDVAHKQVIERANPENIYYLLDMRDYDEEGYSFQHYDPSSKTTLSINLPQFVHLDPKGMAQIYNKSQAEIQHMTDFEIMVDQDLLHNRIRKGILPRVDIASHTFYADARIDLLRPKDDFSSLGIRFDDLDGYYNFENNSYVFPYNPKTHALGELDWENMTAYPKDLLYVEIPDVRVLDPVGWNRRHGYPDTDDLKAVGLALHFKAQLVPWHKSGLDELIAENRLKNPITEAVKARNEIQDKKRGRKL